jgi:DNA-binding response OmpR family regulator
MPSSFSDALVLTLTGFHGESLQEKRMAGSCRLLAFDVDPETLRSLEQAFPGWKIEAAEDTTRAGGIGKRTFADVSLLVVACAERSATLALCRALRRQADWRDTPLLVLVPPAAPELVRDMLEAGANACLVLPVHHKDVSSMLARAQRGNQPGRHTLDLDQAQNDDQWRDEGGQG